MGAKGFWFILIGFWLSGCAVIQSPTIEKIALLAPFEGTHRAIGYNALYAVKLAMTEASVTTLDLLAIDDGGTLSTARDRLQAIALDPAIRAVILVGDIATDPALQPTFANNPLVIVIPDTATANGIVPNDFRDRYLAIDLYVPDPLPIAWHIYQATQQLIQDLRRS